MGAGKSRLDRHFAGEVSPGESFVGFENFGNTCYFNSVVQALYYYLFNAMGNVKKRHGVVAPKKLFHHIRRTNPVFAGYMQQDAEEFLTFLLSDISDSLAPSAAGAVQRPTGVPAEGHRTWIDDIFEIKVTNEIRCMTCETVRSIDENMRKISMAITKNSSITSCLREFSSKEYLRNDCKYFCDHCCSKQEAETRMLVKKLPSVLVLHLKRFEYDEARGTMSKLSHRVVYPLELRLFNTATECEDPHRMYDLFAVVVHSGALINRGHYICLVRKGRHWLILDDDRIDVMTPEEMHSFYGLTARQRECSQSLETAYILLYRARGDSPASSEPSSGNVAPDEAGQQGGLPSD